VSEERLVLTVKAATSIVDAADAEAATSRIRGMVQAHFDHLWAFMRRLGVFEMDLDDAMQEVIVIAATRLNQIPPSSERSFLFSTAFRVGSEWRRKRSGRHEVSVDELLDHEDPIPEPDELTDQARARATLDRVLADMSVELRAVFTLYEIDELTMAEISDLLGLPPGTVASRLRRAREEFEEKVERLQAQMDARQRRAMR
jgi:RNA polymerase sigma-70 factor (ECF subfamily)